MTRWIVAVWSAGRAPMVLLGALLGLLSGALSAGCQTTHVGDPCVPESEYDPAFLGFSQTEVSVETKSFQCETRLCLVDHFQGRVSCPYGQMIDGGPPAAGATSCLTPATNVPVTGMDSTGMFVDMTKQALVEPQCVDRTATDAVYCSCRCANANGQTNDGANYCTCPDGFTCTQLIPAVVINGVVQDPEDTGAYCVKSNAQYQPNVCTASTSSLCQAQLGNCGSAQGVTGSTN